MQLVNQHVLTNKIAGNYVTHIQDLKSITCQLHIIRAVGLDTCQQLSATSHATLMIASSDTPLLGL